MNKVLAQYAGDRMDTRVIELRNGNFGVQYEFSKTKDQWRFPHTHKMEGYATVELARAAARRLLKANN